jgi:uncharacterized protein YjbI with pentapeptide repeats
MIEQDNDSSPLTQRPSTSDEESWRDYWQKQGLPWRTEPEIDEERQEFLAKCRGIRPDIKKGVYPFKNVRLSRADIEWLLVTHEEGRGPVEWDDTRQRMRRGLDLRGANLVGVDLSSLPLARMRGGLTEGERIDTTAKQRSMAAVHLASANLFEAHLEGAFLAGAKLEAADLHRAFLEQTSFMYAHLEGANLRTAHMEGAFLGFAHLNGKILEEHELEHVRQWKHDFPRILAPANLRHAFFDRATNLDSINLGDEEHGFVSVVDVNWGDVNLAMVNWEKMPMVGDEYKLHHPKQDHTYKGHHDRQDDKNKQESSEQLRDYRRAARANRQLSIALQGQGLNEEAARFAYRAQCLLRKISWRRRKYGQYFFSLFLYLLAGYGYRLFNSFLAYVMVIVGFGAAYFLIGPTINLPLSPLEAIVFSMTSFHGRGFVPSQNLTLSSPLTVLAAAEAFVGLIIEITFIATLTQRFFRR